MVTALMAWLKAHIHVPKWLASILGSAAVTIAQSLYNAFTTPGVDVLSILTWKLALKTAIGAVVLKAALWAFGKIQSIPTPAPPTAGPTSVAGLLLALLLLPGALSAQTLGTPIAAHPGDTLHLTYVVAGAPTAIRVVTSTGKILVQSKLTITARPTPPPPPPDTAPAPPPPIAGSPWLFEDFTEYGGSTATFKADPQHRWSVPEDGDFASIGTIDTVGGASWRLDWPDRTGDVSGRCHDYTIGRNFLFPNTVGELWMEAVVRFSHGWTTVAPASWGCASASSYKAMFGRSDVGRFGLYLGIFGTGYEVSYAGNEDPAPGGAWSESADGVSPLFDGAWHVVRLHFRVGSSGLAEFWLDGKKIRTQAGTSTASYLWGAALGRNMNQGPAAPQSLWYQRLAFWQTNPGW